MKKRQILKYLSNYKKESIIAPLFKLLEALFDLMVPLVVAQIINTGIASGKEGEAFVFQMSGVLVALAVVGLACAIAAQYFAAKAAVGFSTNLRGDLFRHIYKLSFSDLDRMGTSELENRMISDVNQLQNGVNMSLRLLLRSPFIVFGALVMAFVVNANVALVFVAIIPVLGLIVALILKVTAPRYKDVQSKLGGLLGTARENVLGVRVVRAFGQEEAQADKFAEKNNGLYHSQMGVGRISALLNPLTTAVINIGIVAILSTGAIRIEIGGMAQGDVVALIDYMAQILVELIKLANTIVLLSKSIASADRIVSVFNVEPSMKYCDKKNSENNADAYAVEFDHVSFNYNDAGENELDDISFAVNKGETVGIIGATASGKTTLIHLLSRFYDVDGGAVRIDGVDVREYTREEINSKVEVVMQKSVLFQGTIRDNLTMGRLSATDDEIREVLEIAQASLIVDDRKLGLDELVEQGGRNFSGGQKQRLSIARTLLKGVEILVLDDSSSALDYKTDADLRKAIANMPEGKKPTTFIVSQRAASMMNADKIIVLDEGRIVGIGTHKKLIEECDVYREIFESQFKTEEVAS